MKATVLLADDHQVLLSGLKKMLEEEFDIVGTVSDGVAMVTEAKRLRPDLILADVSMPEMNGIEALMKLRSLGVESKVVFLTMHIDATYAGRALEAGALGYILKTEDPQILIAALRAALRGQRYLSEQIARSLEAVTMRSSTSAVSLMGRLTQRQLEVLKLFSEGYTAKEVADRLKITSRTAEFHKYRIMAILNVKSSAELVAYAMRHGLA